MIRSEDRLNKQKGLDAQLILLNSTLDIQKSLNKQVLVFTKSLADSLSLDGLANDNIVNSINDVMLLLNQSNKNISDVQILIDTITVVAQKNKKRNKT